MYGPGRRLGHKSYLVGTIVVAYERSILATAKCIGPGSDIVTLRLGLHRLPNAEVVLIQTLLRLYGGNNDETRWAIAETPPFDAVLVDATAGEGASVEARRLARSVLRICRMGHDQAPDTIQRPIRSDQLFEWLNSRTSAVEQTQAASIHQDENDGADEAELSVRYRLKRWPPSIVLRNDSRRMYLATLLSKRALSISDIAAMSRQPLEDCRTFVRLLRSTGLVEAKEESLPASVNIESSPTVQAKPARKRSLAKGLIGQLRRKLGL